MKPGSMDYFLFSEIIYGGGAHNSTVSINRLTETGQPPRLRPRLTVTLRRLENPPRISDFARLGKKIVVVEETP